MVSQFRTFVLPRASDEVAERELNDFLRAHRVVTVQRAYADGGWTFCVEWTDGKSAEPEGRGRRYGSTERVDYMKVLEPDVFAVFARLRTRRRELAEEHAVPPFAVATDAQLAEMAKLKEPSADKLGTVEGFGAARVKAYGEAFLRILAEKLA